MKVKPVSLIVAAAILSVVIISQVHGYVFPRTEGEALSKRVDKLDPVLRDINKRLSRIEGALGVKKD